MTPLAVYVLLGAALFALGLVGFVTRRNLIIMFLCTELMFQGIILNLVGFARYPLSGPPRFDGHVFALFLLAIAACEAALGLALVVLLYRHRGVLDAGSLNLLKEE
jgi:NADH-quinone oxidoreductase subunit K